MINTLKKLNLSYSAEECKWSGAVNFLFVQNYLLLISRSETMPTHAGQLGFVGGHRAIGEENPIDTALRELEEETGLCGVDIEVLGLIEAVHTSNNKLIIPVITYSSLDPHQLLRDIKSNGEWNDALLVPIEYLLRKEHWSFGLSMRGSNNYKIKFCPLIKGSFLSTQNSGKDEYLLWGATAKMIGNFFKYYSSDDKEFL